MKLSDYVWERIAQEGVKDVFYLPGGGCMHLVDSLGRNPNLHPICCLHEQGAAIATDAYAQVQGFGACLVTTGPGGTNTITGVAAAWADSTPMIVISGQVKTADLKGNLGVRQLGFQELDIVEIVKSITKYAFQIKHPQQIKMVLDKLLLEARSGRPGPVWLDIPLDVQAAEVTDNVINAVDIYKGDTLLPDEVSTTKFAVDILDSMHRARKPAILLGNGCRGCIPEALEFSARFNIPILTTWKAIDFIPEDYPRFAGRPGAAGQLGANLTQQNADWLLVLGARLDHGQIAYEQSTFAPKAHKIIVDIDHAELNKLTFPCEKINTDAKKMLGSLLSMTTYCDKNLWGLWNQQVNKWQADNPVIKPEYKEEKDYVNVYALVEALSDLLGEGDLLVPGSSGQCSEIIHQAWKVKKGLRILNSQGLGAMGFGVPAALGACIASGGKRTVVIEGDGGFAMNTQELEVIGRLNLPIKIFVLDNGGYGSIRGTQRSYFEGRLVGSDESSGLTLPPIVGIADVYGIKSFVIWDNSRLDEVIDWVFRWDGPVIVNVRVSPNQQTLPRVQSYRDSEGKMHTKPMEEMYLGPA